MYSRPIAIAIFIFCLLWAIVAANGADVTPDNPAGWRGNWSGRFPECTPPVTWERRCTSPVSEIRYSLHKPAKDSDADAGTIKPASQSIVHWMLLGPFAPKNPSLALDEETIPNETASSPDDETKAAVKDPALAWKVFEQKSIEELFADDKPTDDASESVEFETAFSKEALASLPPGQGVAYAHTYLYSPRAGTVALLLNHANGLQIWVNGKIAYSQNHAVVSGCVDHYAFAKFEWHWGETQTVDLKLEKGWNRVLFKSVRGDKGWFMNLRLTAPADAGYEGKNIAWETHLPSRGFSCPIVVGEKIFLTAEVDDLLCIDKKDGKILWRRSNNFYDAAAPQERASNPLWQSLDMLNVKLQSTTRYMESLALHKQMQDVLLKIDREKFKWGDPRFGPVQGNAVPTACSDGKQVYVYFSSGVAACYDLEGNRKWIRLNRDIGEIGGYNTQSPAIFDGTLIIYRHLVRGLDASTGEIRWTSTSTGEDERAQCVVPLLINGEKCVIAHHNHYYRARDGLFLGGGSGVHHATAVLAENNTVINCMDSGFDQWRILGIVGNAVSTKGLPGAGSPFAGTYNVASPLYEAGMVYVMNLNGNFMAWEYNDSAAKLAYSFKRLKDMNPLVQAWRWNVGLCASPMLGGKYVYIMDNQGTTLTLEPGHAYKQVSINKIENYLKRGWITNTQENTYSSPVCDGNTLFLRGDETLYCIRGVSAVPNADTVSGEAPLHVNFDGRNSFSGDGRIVSYAWEFGDEPLAVTATSGASHDYSVPGAYTAKLTVKDEQGASGIAETKITVLPPDTIAPKVTTAVAGYGRKVAVTFSKPIARISAENTANYTISPEMKILSAQLQPNQPNGNSQIVVLDTAPLLDGVNYTLTLINITDCAKKPNSLATTKVEIHNTGLVTHWKLNEGSGVAIADSSGFGNDARVKDTLTPAWEDGGDSHPGKVLNFNGMDNNVVVATTGFPDLSIPFSIALWVNPARRQDEMADILGNHGEPFMGFMFQQDGKKMNNYSLGYGDGKQWQGAGPIQLKASTWQHLTAVCDGENVILYIDGVEKARSQATTQLLPNSKLNFRLGQGHATARYFRGALSDVHVYSKALSPAEVAELAKWK